MPKVSIESIEGAARAALMAHGAPDRVAGVMAGAVAWAEARGNRICGLYYLESYCQQLRSGRVRGDAEPRITRPRPGAVHVDAGFGFAQTAFLAALPEALRAMRECGVATLAIGHSHTCTALGWFTEGAAREGAVVIGMTNASPIVAPPGGRGRVIGTNPIAFAVPGEGGIAMAFDQSTTQVALGHVTMAKAAGREIPEGWGVDTDGRPATDPGAVLDGGALASAGGHKGWGIGLMVEILASGMTGGRLSKDVAPLKAPDGPPHDLGQVFVLIDPDVAPDMGDRLEGLVVAVEAAGGRLPGRGRVEMDDVDVPDALWQGTLALGTKGA